LIVAEGDDLRMMPFGFDGSSGERERSPVPRPLTALAARWFGRWKGRRCDHRPHLFHTDVQQTVAAAIEKALARTARTAGTSRG
jgi:hypothetical protein